MAGMTMTPQQAFHSQGRTLEGYLAEVSVSVLHVLVGKA